MLRIMKVSDAKSLRDINEVQLGYKATVSETEEHIEKLNQEIDNHFMLVYEHNQTKEVLGYVHAQLYESIFAPPMFNILALAVSKKFEKSGIGRSLMEEVEKEARRRKLFGIRLNSNVKRKEAHEFYSRIGYRSDKLQKRFIKEV